jgi:tetratricopeptide (TPR) repeat protein
MCSKSNIFCSNAHTHTRLTPIHHDGSVVRDMSHQNHSITSKAEESQCEDAKDGNYDHTLPLRCMSSLAQRAYDATVVRNYGNGNGNGSACEDNPMLLPCTPWKLRYNNNGSESATAMTTATSDGPYPHFNYLDLRRHQNNSWATSRFLEGIALAKMGKLTEAEACYHEGLDLVPNHAPMLVAYGALCANLGRTYEGIAKLEQALALNPDVENGRTYLNAIQQRLQQQQLGKPQRERLHRESNSSGLTLRTDKALQSAMAEHAIISAEGERHKESLDEKYPLLAEKDVTSSGDDHHRRRRKGKKKKRKTKRHDSGSSSDEESRRRRKKRKKRRRNSPESDDVISRRRHDSSS